MARISVQLTIDDAAAVERMALDLERRLNQCALVIEASVIGRISTGQAVRRLPSGRLIGLNPSRPGQPPHVLYGHLRQSITHDVRRSGTRITARVGSNLIYARPLELGSAGRGAGGNTSLAPRPYLRPSLVDSWSQIAGIFSRG